MRIQAPDARRTEADKRVQLLCVCVCVCVCAHVGCADDHTGCLEVNEITGKYTITFDQQIYGYVFRMNMRATLHLCVSSIIFHSARVVSLSGHFRMCPNDKPFTLDTQTQPTAKQCRATTTTRLGDARRYAQQRLLLIIVVGCCLCVELMRKNCKRVRTSFRNAAVHASDCQL